MHDQDRTPWCATHCTRHNPYVTAAVGFALLVIGSVLTLDTIGAIDAGIVEPFWPVLLMGIGAAHFVRSEGPWRIVGGVVWIVLGSLFLARNFDLVGSFGVWDLWPLVLVLIGARLLLKWATGSNRFLRNRTHDVDSG